MDKLLPCPFCSESEKLEGDCRISDENTPYIICRTCGACSPDSGEYNWNNRKGIQERDEVIKVLVEACKEISKGKGAYSIDRLEHAINIIENMKEMAEQAIARANPANEEKK